MIARPSANARRRWWGVAVPVTAAFVGWVGCARQPEGPGARGAPDAAEPMTPAPQATAVSVSVVHPPGSHPRILLTNERLAGLLGLRDRGAPAWRRLADACEHDSRQTIESGYEAWDWANATLDLALCHVVTRKPEYASAALQYFRAILDDRQRVGDGRGGDDIVHHDHGYSIRTRGSLGAIAYDWLHELPGMTPALRAHAIDRFVAWTTWFSTNGYNRDQPIANYYMGWFGAVAFGAIAIEGDDRRAVGLRSQTERMYGAGIVPTYSRKLAGGDFPEGWQYGDMVGAFLAIFADAESQSGRAPSPFDELPWLRESVAYRTHSLWPDDKHLFDNGDWSDKPAVAPRHLLLALATTLPSNDPAGRRARSLAELAVDAKEEWQWLATLAYDPSRTSEDPRRGATSYLSRGTATVTARTDWSRQAVWFGFTSAPSLSDHQHLDAGHFEIVRGSDPLVIDAGAYGSYSSLSHNVISVDDKKENDTYCPNQGMWSDTAHIERFEDTGRFVYALADYTSAYNPVGFPGDHPQRSVARALREVVFSRTPVAGLTESARVIVRDQITVTKPSYGVTFLLHGGSAPEVNLGGVRFATGKSAAFVTTLVPAAAVPVPVHEPTDLGEGPFFANEPPEGVQSIRVEMRSPLGDVNRRFLHAIVVAAGDARPPAPAGIEGDAIDGVAVEDEAYVFVRDDKGLGERPVTYRAPLTALRHVVLSLAPGMPYAASVQRDRDRCRVAVQRLSPEETHGRRASSAGVLILELASGCLLQ